VKVINLKKMRNYQTLTLIGSILGIIIAFSLYMFLMGSDSGLSSIEQNSTKSGSLNLQTKLHTDMTEISTQIGICIILMVIAVVVVFVLSRQIKAVGIYLLMISLALLVGMGFYGILPFILFLPAGIIALRYNIHKGNYDTRDDDGMEEKDHSTSGGESPIK
jgi:hypothetical protein